MTKRENFLKGFIKENPIFVSLLGMCPALAVTGTFETSLGMGLLVVFVLTSSNVVISLVKNFIPNEVRTPAYIVIIATFVTIVQMLTDAYAPLLAEALGVFIPLIVVNCLILGRAEIFASKNKVIDSAIDGFGMALGFTFALIVLGITRELLATGGIMYGDYLPFFVEQPMNLFTFDWIINIFVQDFKISDYGLEMFALPPGAFLALAFILAFMQSRKNKKERLIEEAKKQRIEELKKAAIERKKQAAMKKASDAS